VDNELKSITLNNNEKLETGDLIVAVWHSARDTVTMLFENRKIKWFANWDAILTAIEARSSSVVKFTRDKETCESNIKWLYPCWEWAWFAGLITSSAIDWLRVAESIIEKYV
jgi:uncharacterized FAD-dependent dehydrogenase